MQKVDIFNTLGVERPVIFDIGAHNGADALEFAELGARVYCFDPIEHDRRHHELISWHNYAVGAHDKYTVMHTASNHIQSSSLREPKTHLYIFPQVVFDGRRSVECIKLDTWFKQFKKIQFHKTIDLIWCDVNGSEADFIEGAKETLKQTRYLIIECSDKELYKGQMTAAQIEHNLGAGWQLLEIFNHLGNYGNYFYKNNGI